MPRVSVIIPTCKRVDAFTRAVLSVLHQDFSDLDVVVVDDNIEDCTNKLIYLFSGEPQVKVVRNFGNHGPSQARNVGVKAAHGELITFLDDDDCFLPGRLSSLLSFYEQVGDQYSFISSGRFAETGDFSEIHPIHGQKFGIITIEDLKFGNSIDISVLMKRSFFLELGGFDESLSSLEDWDLFIRALKVKNGYKIKRLDYAVNRTEGRDRVSERETTGYFDIAEKYAKEFGYKWSFIPKAKGLILSDNFSLAKSLFYCYRSSSIRPAKLYLSSRFPRLIGIVKAFAGLW
jgi:glycosyltransferase involved in cell wall biosynthesis